MLQALSNDRVPWKYVLFAALVACGPGTGNGPDAGPDAGDPVVDAAPDPIDAHGIDAAPPPEFASVYAHSSDTLYRVNPDTLEVAEIAAFGWPIEADSMTDIAIDGAGRMIGVSFTRVYEVNEDTAACTFLADLVGAGFNGLSFVPDPDNPNVEILIGANLDGEVYELDPQTGVSTLVGNYGGGYISSGDIVSVKGAGTFATVTTAGDTVDYLASIDPANGYAATIIGDTGYDSIWGLGYWRNKVFGFTDNNEFLTTDVATGAASLEQAGAVSWWGAGVTTSAPIIE